MDQEETLLNNITANNKPDVVSRKSKPVISPRIKSADTYRSLNVLNRIDERFKDYEILFNIENENQIKVPKGDLFFLSELFFSFIRGFWT